MSLSQTEERLRETLCSYNRNPEFYAERYCAADLGSYRTAFINALPDPKGRVLDAGCGPGRDCSRFHDVGISVIGLDYSIELLRIARARAPVPLVGGDLRALPFLPNTFDGVWLCSSLVHLPAEYVTTILHQVRGLLRLGGVMFASVMHGNGPEWRPDPFGGRRWFVPFTESEFLELIKEANLAVTDVSVEPGVISGTWINVTTRHEL